MSILNKTVRGFFYVGLIAFALLQSCVMGIFFSGAVLSVVTAVWTIIKPLPSVMTEKMWLIYILSGIPASIYIFVYLVADLIKSRSKKHKKQDNGNN